MASGRVCGLARAGVAGLALSGLAGVVSGAGAAGAAAAGGPVRGAPAARHFNTGAAHSPQLLRQLAGPAGAVLAGAQRGVDVADYQERSGIDWGKVAAAGIQFAAIKATEGGYYRNPYALKDLAAARKAGLSVLAYAFAIPNGAGASASPPTQAGDLVSYLRNGGVSPLPPLELDIEYNPYRGGECYGLSQAAMVSWVRALWPQSSARPAAGQSSTPPGRGGGPAPAAVPLLARPRCGCPTTPPPPTPPWCPAGGGGRSGSTPAPGR